MMNERFHVEWLTQIADQPLPDEVKAKDGDVFDPRTNHWKYKSIGTNVSCNFESLPEVTPIFLNGYKQALIDAAISFAGVSVPVYVKESVAFLSIPVLGVITAPLLLVHSSM